MLALVLCGFLPGMGICVPLAGAVENPYQGIVDRNVFNLKPLPPATPPELPPPPVPKITLTGITTILGNKRALMKVQIPPKPPEPAKEESYILTEGQRDGDIEVLAIDEQAASVKVNNHGTVQELTFDKDGPKSPASPIPAAGPPGFRPPFPNMPNRQTVSNPPPRTIPSRTLRLPSMPGAQPPGAGPTAPASPPHPAP